MKNIFFWLFLAVCPLAATAASIPTAPYLPTQSAKAQKSKAPITVQYPYEKMKVSRGAKHMFILGQVNLSQPATLDINGQEVDLFKNGAFVAFVPLQSGTNELILTAKNKDNSVQAIRRVIVPGNDIKDFSAKAAFDKEEVFPQRPIELLPGEKINLYVRGTPGAKVHASLPDFKHGKNITLKEDASRPGTYRAAFVVDGNQPAQSAKITYQMTGGPKRSKAKITSPAKIIVRDQEKPFTYAKVTSPGVKLRKLPTASGNLFPDYRAYGPLRVTGEMASQYHLYLSDTEAAWLEKKRLKLLKDFDETPNTLSFIRTHTAADHTRLVFTLDRAVPIKIHEYQDRLELVLYYIDYFEPNFSLDETSPLLENIQWSQPTERAIAFRLQLSKKEKLWGYSYNFEDNELVVDLIHAPKLKPTKNKPLAGVRIALDAGHSPKRNIPYDGAIGPTGYLEYEATMALAQDLKPMLEKAGATVLMTRHDDNQMSLQNRYDFALANNAHLFVSLHYTALPETVNPLAKPRGYSVYYAYPHSFALAESVYKAYNQHVPLPDNGLIANDVLFIPRMPQFPSILVESAYLILPEQEELAKSKDGRALFTKALYEGIVNFFKNQGK